MKGYINIRSNRSNRLCLKYGSQGLPLLQNRLWESPIEVETKNKGDHSSLFRWQKFLHCQERLTGCNSPWKGAKKSSQSWIQRSIRTHPCSFHGKGLIGCHVSCKSSVVKAKGFFLTENYLRTFYEVSVILCWIYSLHLTWRGSTLEHKALQYSKMQLLTPKNMHL